MDACCVGKTGIFCWSLVFLFVLGGLGRALFINKNPPIFMKKNNHYD
jgi:hypothetical protein